MDRDALREEEACALAVCDLYASLPANGKPREGKEFTVLAGFVCVKARQELMVLSLATGTKCCGQGMCHGFRGAILGDSHAEVLARRGLVRYLSKWLLMLADEPGRIRDEECPLEAGGDGEGGGGGGGAVIGLRWKRAWKLHLYISDSPCGDASIYEKQGEEGDEHETKMLAFTGAKLVSNEKGAEVQREEVQALGALRTKSGRSDIRAEQRTTSMSCSDKLCRWRQLGVQGAVLSNVLVEPVSISGLHIGADPLAKSEAQASALVRALDTRLSGSAKFGSKAQQTLRLHVLAQGVGFPGKCSSISRIEQDQAEEKLVDGSGAGSKEDGSYNKKRKLGLESNPKRLAPTGTSINWIANVCSSSGGGDLLELRRKRVVHARGGSVEVTLAASGSLQGAVKSSIGTVEASSRLCKKSFAAMWENVTQKVALHVASCECNLCIKLQVLKETTSELKPAPEPEGKMQIFTNSWWKRRESWHSLARAEFLASEPFSAWLCDQDDQEV